MTEALIVVDMQNLFVDLVGDVGPRVLEEVNQHVAKAAANGTPIFYTRDYAPIDLPDGDPQKRTALHPDLDIRGTVLAKGPGKHGGMSGFVLAPLPDTDLGNGSLGPLVGALRQTGADAVTVVGIATDVCVAATARDAIRLGYAASIPLSATAFVHAHPAGDDAALAELRAAGVTLE